MSLPPPPPPGDEPESPKPVGGKHAGQPDVFPAPPLPPPVGATPAEVPDALVPTANVPAEDPPPPPPEDVPAAPLPPLYFITFAKPLTELPPFVGGVIELFAPAPPPLASKPALFVGAVFEVKLNHVSPPDIGGAVITPPIAPLPTL